MKRGALLLVLLAACGSAARTGGGFVLTDGAISGPDLVATGATTLTIDNEGEFNHTLVVTDPDGDVIAATAVIPPGTSVSLDVELSDGSYLVSCRLVTQDQNGNIFDHYEQGMWKEVSTSG